jgi:hypothetical protein
MKHSYQPLRHVRLAVVIALFMVAVQVAAEKPLSASSPVQSDPNREWAEPSDLNMRRTLITRNPVTGNIEFTPGSGTRAWDLSPQEKNMLSRSDEGLQPTILANGAVAVNLRGRFQSMITTSSELGSNQLKTSCSIIDAVPSPDEQLSDVYD